jgi:hypothetical protein
VLAIELQNLIEDDFDIELPQFALAEAENIRDDARERSPSGEDDRSPGRMHGLRAESAVTRDGAVHPNRPRCCD